MHLGIAGEIRCVVSNDDGLVKTDTGFNNNLILDQGLEFFGGGHGNNIFNQCVVGSGTSAPAATQVALDNFVAMSAGTLIETDFDYIDDASDLYKTSKTYKYRFTSLTNVDIGEAGLASEGTTESNHYLCTRVLIKDSSGDPIAINTGDTLDIYYKVSQVYSTLDTTHTINKLNGAGESEAYDVKCRLGKAGNKDIYDNVGKPLAGGNAHSGVFSGEPVGVKSAPATSLFSFYATDYATYAANSYKRKLTVTLALDQANGSVRTMGIESTMGFWQMRYGLATDDSAIVKTDKDTLTIPVEISWGRYSGAL